MLPGNGQVGVTEGAGRNGHVGRSDRASLPHSWWQTAATRGVGGDRRDGARAGHRHTSRRDPDRPARCADDRHRNGRSCQRDCDLVPSGLQRRWDDHRVRDHAVRPGDRRATGDRQGRQCPKRCRHWPCQRHDVRVHRRRDQLSRHRCCVWQVQSGDPCERCPRRANHRHGHARQQQCDGDLESPCLRRRQLDHRLSDHPLHRHHRPGRYHRRRRPQLRRDRSHQRHHLHLHRSGDQRHQHRSGVSKVEPGNTRNRSGNADHRHCDRR